MRFRLLPLVTGGLGITRTPEQRKMTLTICNRVRRGRGPQLLSPDQLSVNALRSPAFPLM
jgi:hypothetical protein